MKISTNELFEILAKLNMQNTMNYEEINKIAESKNQNIYNINIEKNKKEIFVNNQGSDGSSVNIVLDSSDTRIKVDTGHVDPKIFDEMKDIIGKEIKSNKDEFQSMIKCIEDMKEHCAQKNQKDMIDRLIALLDILSKYITILNPLKILFNQIFQPF